MAAWRRAESEGESAGVNLTPMLDVAFILLIFFLVTASFARESGIAVNRPDAASAEPQRAAMVIALTAEHEIWINRRRVDLASLPAQVTQLQAQMPQGTVLIEADRAASTGLLVQVMDVLRRAGIEAIALGTGPARMRLAP